VVLNPIILILGVWFLLNKFNKPQSIIIKDEIRDVPMRTKSDVNIKRMKSPENIYSSNEYGVKVKDSGGELIPFNLSDEEKELLNSFYRRD